MLRGRDKWGWENWDHIGGKNVYWFLQQLMNEIQS